MKTLLFSLTLTLALGLARPLRAQDVLRGRVTDAETSRPLEAVMVSVVRGGITVDYALTDADGRYSLPWRYEGTLQVCASLLGYGRQARDAGRPGLLDFALRPESIVLREVEIRPGRISTRRDTVRYRLADFLTDKDTHVRDVLKRLPGIDVEDNGTITYQGRPIDHFLVEGMDVTGGRYNQVSNNLDARAVKSAELMENYQSVRALKGQLSSGQVALNLRLDEHARDQWFLSLEAGGGVTQEDDGRPAPLWDGALSALQLGSGRQSILALKSNNTGRDLSGEQVRLTDDALPASPLPALLAQPAVSTPLDTRRLLFNQTWTANANRMLRRSDERTLRLQADYTRNRTDRHSGFTQAFYTAADTVSLAEESHYRLVSDALHAELAYEDNGAERYLANRFGLEAERSRGRSDELGQTVVTGRLAAYNHLGWLKNRDGRTWELASDVRLSVLPSGLRLAFGRDDYTLRSLYAGHTARYLRRHNGLTRSLRAGLTAEWAACRMETPADALAYDASSLAAHAEPQLEWERGGLLLSARAPLRWARYFGAGRSYLLYSPRLYLRYRHDYHWKFSLYGSLSREAGHALDLCPYVRRTDYRTLTSTAGLMPLRTTVSGQLYAEYKNTVQEFFATLTLTCSRGFHSTLTGQYVSQDTLATVRRAQANTTDTWTLASSLSKGVFDWRLKASLDLELTRHRGRQLIRTALPPEPATLQDFRYDCLTAIPKLTWTPVPWLEAAYHATLTYSSTRLDGSARLQPLTDLVQRLSLSVTLGRVEVRAGGEHYRNALGDGTHLSLLLADVSALWRHDRWRLEAGVSNLFNRTMYAATAYTALQSRTDWLRIRPRELSAKVSFRF